MAGSAGEAGAAADAIGYPVVLKIVSPDIEHKTEIGGVLVGVADRDAVDRGYAELMDRAAKHRPDAAIEGVLVAPMAKEGVETIIGVMRDPVFGPAVMFGLGGVHVEVLKDVSFRLAPFDRDEAMRMIDQIRGARFSTASAARRHRTSTPWQMSSSSWLRSPRLIPTTSRRST